MATRTTTAKRRTTTRTVRAAAPAPKAAPVEEPVENRIEEPIEDTFGETEDVPVGVPVVDPVAERLPYRIEDIDLESVRGVVRIRLHLRRGNLHLAIYLPPEALTDLIHVSDYGNDDGDMSQLRGHAVLVGFDAEERPIRLADIYDPMSAMEVPAR